MDIKDRSNKLHIPFASRFELALCVALGCLNIVVASVLCEYLNTDTIFTAIIVTLAYFVEIMSISLYRMTDVKVKHDKSIHALLAEDGSVVFKNTDTPIIAIDSYGVILWYNDALRNVIKLYDNFIDSNITELFEISINDVKNGSCTIHFNNSVYVVEGFEISGNDAGVYMLLMNDVTKQTEMERRYFDERVAVAYIAIDNVDDVLQYVHEKFADAVSKIDDKLKEWAKSMNGIIKSYDNDKYIMLFDSVCLDKCIADRFSILDEIRDTRVGDGVSITVSIGVSRGKETLAEREIDARDAIDLALQRGGDQVVYKSDSGTEHYGGKTKTVYKRSNVKSRTFAVQLTASMVRADNVIVMGHRYGDFDSFGASVGVARLATLCGSTVNIAVDMRDNNLLPCIEMLQATEGYSQVFVDNTEGLDLIGPDTLVVLVDHNTIARAQFSDIAMKAGSIAIIDHHRKTDTLPDVVKLSYIEPSASSACELVTEMLESSVSSQYLLKEEADVLLAGILLDTKQFTRNTGTRTFGAAQYLRGAGANPSDVYNLFKTAPADLAKEAKFHTSITMYNDNIAISSCDGETDESYRIVASKAADKMLTLRGVDAAFALVHIGDQVHISGRSNGKINVQLILEKLKGGGHFDVAGAQVESDSIMKVLEMLKSGIDDYTQSVQIPDAVNTDTKQVKA